MVGGGAAWAIPAGLLLAAVFPEDRIACMHVTYVGGFGLLAFAVVSHTSLLVIGLFSLHESGIQGAMLLAANFGLAVTGMWFIVGFVFRRTGTTELHELSGL